MSISMRATMIILSCGLAACGGNVKQSASTVQCSGTNWYKVGFDAVMEGKPVRYFDTFKQMCGDKLENGAVKLYQNGYVDALKEFCTEENGYKIGNIGKPAPDVCLFELKRKFDAGYAKGVMERREKIEKMKRLSEEKVTAPTNADRAEQQPGYPH